MFSCSIQLSSILFGILLFIPTHLMAQGLVFSTCCHLQKVMMTLTFSRGKTSP